MKIGIDARFYGEAGPGRYVKNIIAHLEQIDNKNEYVLFLRQKGFDLYNPTNNNFKKILLDYKWYTWGEQVGFLWGVLKQRLDLFYVPHFNIPVLYPKKVVTAIPDIIMHSFSTERGTTLFKPYFIFKKFVYKLVVSLAVSKSKKVIVPSNDVKNDFIKYFPKVDPRKFVLAYEGLDPELTHDQPESVKILDKYKLRKPYLLYISSMYEHKNVCRLLEAFKVLKEKYKFSGQLLLVGKKDKYSLDMQRRVIQESLRREVIIPGIDSYVSDADSAALRKEACVYVFPSLKEGFSLTPMEAQYHGLPCAISDIPCHREIYGNSVLYFDPYSVHDMAEKVNQLIKDTELRANLVNKGYENVRKYSWLNTANITLDVFNHVMENR